MVYIEAVKLSFDTLLSKLNVISQGTGTEFLNKIDSDGKLNVVINTTKIYHLNRLIRKHIDSSSSKRFYICGS